MDTCTDSRCISGAKDTIKSKLKPGEKNHDTINLGWHKTKYTSTKSIKHWSSNTKKNHNSHYTETNYNQYLVTTVTPRSLRTHLGLYHQMYQGISNWRYVKVIFIALNNWVSMSTGLHHCHYVMVFRLIQWTHHMWHWSSARFDHWCMISYNAALKWASLQWLSDAKMKWHCMKNKASCCFSSL